VAFILSVWQTGFAIWRWTHVPTFRLIEATFAVAGPTPKMQSVRAYSMMVIATGGARPRRIIDWSIYQAPVDETGAAKGLGGINTLQPIDQVVPAHDVVKFQLSYNPGGGTVVGEATRLRAVLTLDLGKYQEIVPFELFRSNDIFLLDEHPRPMMAEPRGWRRRLRYELGKRLP
jgi:hypothetical protein